MDDVQCMERTLHGRSWCWTDITNINHLINAVITTRDGDTWRKGQKKIISRCALYSFLFWIQERILGTCVSIISRVSAICGGSGTELLLRISRPACTDGLAIAGSWEGLPRMVNECWAYPILLSGTLWWYHATDVARWASWETPKHVQAPVWLSLGLPGENWRHLCGSCLWHLCHSPVKVNKRKIWNGDP